MQQQSHRNLESLAEQDPVSRPLARLQLEALRASADDIWERALAGFSPRIPRDATPALHAQEIPVDAQSLISLIARLTDVLVSEGIVTDEAAVSALREIDPTALLKAAIEWDAESFERLAEAAGVEPPVVVTLAYCAALPVTLACGRTAIPPDADMSWNEGYCPVCANWPLIGEDRGLEKQLWLRCGRCAAAWRARHQQCPYCDNTDHRQLGYMAPEGERESRRAITCEACTGYLKVFATVSPLSVVDLLHQDLASLELDVAAMDAGYMRPERPGFEIEIDIVQVRSGAGSWVPWR